MLKEAKVDTKRWMIMKIVAGSEWTLIAEDNIRHGGNL